MLLSCNFTSEKKEEEEEMESKLKRLGFEVSKNLKQLPPSYSIKGVVGFLNEVANEDDHRPTMSLGMGDPSYFKCFRTATIAEDAVAEALRSAKFNSYAPTGGIFPARKAIAEYLSNDLPYRLSPDDVYVTVGCKDAMEVMVKALARPEANILFPRTGYRTYETFARNHNLEFRLFDLLPERGWDVDLDAIEAIADENTIAMIIINPGNPCGSVYSYEHLNKIAETARKLGIIVVSDEVYGHVVFGSKPFVPMGVFGSTVPVITLGSISKRWMVPGWRLGWLVLSDPTGLLQNSGISDSIIHVLNPAPFSPTFIQAAVPKILEQTTKDFFSKTIDILRSSSEFCYKKLKEVPCISCPQKAEGAMFVLVKLDFSLLEGIKDDMDFCLKLAKEESLVILPGESVGMKNWLRITFSVEHSDLEDGLGRLKAFCQRYAKKP